MKLLTLLLLISATVQGQSDTVKPGVQFPIEYRTAELHLKPLIEWQSDSTYISNRAELYKLHFDTIPGALQVIEWEQEYTVNTNACPMAGCLVYHKPVYEKRKRIDVRWVEGYEVKSWYGQDHPSHHIYAKTYYLTADKELLPERVTVALFVEKPESK